MTLLKDNLGTTFGNVQFGVQKSYRYHTARQRHYERLSQLISFCTILFSALWGMILLESPNSWYAFVGPALIISLSALDIAYKPSVKGVEHKILARQFNELEMEMIVSDKTKASAESFQVKRQKIEITEPPDKAVLNDVIHNELCRAIGSTSGIEEISSWRKFLCHWIDLPPKKLRSTT